MKKLISVITVLFVMFTATNAFAGRKNTVSICGGLQEEIIKSVKEATEYNGFSRTAAFDRMKAAQMAMFWLELFRMKSCGLLDESANIDSLVERLLGN